MGVLEVKIVNQKWNKAYKEGIRARLEQSQLVFNLRERGHALDFQMDDLKVDLFSQSLENPNYVEETHLILLKLLNEHLRKHISLYFQDLEF